MKSVLMNFWSDFKTFLFASGAASLFLIVIGIINNSTWVIWPLVGIALILPCKGYVQYIDQINGEYGEYEKSGFVAAVFLISSSLLGPLTPIGVGVGYRKYRLEKSKKQVSQIYIKEGRLSVRNPKEN